MQDLADDSLWATYSLLPVFLNGLGTKDGYTFFNEKKKKEECYFMTSENYKKFKF